MPTPTLVPPAPRALRRIRPASALLLLLSVVLGLALGLAPQASAHATLRQTTPAEDSVVGKAPRHVTLAFSEGIGISESSIRVFDPAGRRVDDGAPMHVGSGDRTVRVALRGRLPRGTFTVAWRGVSADSHPVAGAFVFSVGAPSGTRAPLLETTAGGGATGVIYDTVRYVAYSGFTVLVGGSAFVLLCWPRGAVPRPLRRLLLGAWAAMAVSALAQLMLRAPYESGGGLGGAFDLAALRDTLGTKPGAALSIRLLLLAAGGAFLLLLGQRSENGGRFGPGPRAGLVAAGALLATGLAGTWSAAEHASAGIQVPLAIPLDVLHLLAAAGWLGGLAALTTALFLVRDGDQATGAAVNRFSRVAFTAVVVLAATGAYQTWRQVGSWDALVTTPYGRLLLVKMSAVGLLLWAAHRSRRWTARLRETPRPAAQVRETELETVTAGTTMTAGGQTAVPAGTTRSGGNQTAVPAGTTRSEDDHTAVPAGTTTSEDNHTAVPAEPPESGADAARRGLRRSVGAEAAVAVVVLAVTTVLTGTPPGRAAAEEGASASSAAPALGVVNATVPFDTGARNGRGRVRITLDPGQAGDNAIQAAVFDVNDGFISVPELRIRFTLPERKLGPLDANLRDLGGYWAADSLKLPFAGSWKMSVTVRTSEIDQVTETRTIRIGQGAGPR